ncbi:MAG: tetratricopeptide repeat protein, partial [Planctomycetales bacterium]|nr:tetratricopeptide repeat protein [Planctomycetales bacterium]
MVSPAKIPPVSEVVSLAVTLHQSGHVVEAEELYKRALEREPDHVDALHFLGVLRHQQGDSTEAARLIRLALRTNPSYFGARVNLGNVLKESERFAEAETEYRKVLQADPKNAGAWNNLGAALRVLKRTDEAIAAFQSAVKLQPRFAEAYQNLGNAFKSGDRMDEALTAYRTAVEIEPGNTTAHLSLGRALYMFGRIDEALIVYRKWLEIDPDNAVAKHMVASCAGGQVPERCSDEFVKKSFDAFASSFDEVLQRLDYRAPELIEEAIQNALPPADGTLVVLDAGCGTGLCGESLKPFAETLVGVDLSPKMLQKAKLRRLYDELAEAELASFMARHPNEYDLIASADTLIY